MKKHIDELIRSRAAVDPFGRPTREALQEYERAKAALNEEAAKNWDNETWHRQMAAVISERLDFGFEFNSLFSTYFETKVVGDTDIETITERRGLQVFWTARGGYIDETQLKTERFEIPRDTIGFHVSEFSDKLKANYAETIEELVDLAEQRLDAETHRRMFQMLQTAIPTTSPYYVAATTGVTKANIDKALRDVTDAIRPNGASVPPVTIIGRAAMIDAMSDLVPAMNDPEGTAEIRRKGRLGVYRGANVVRLLNYTDENDASYIPANELWVFAGTVGKFVKYGGMKTKSWEENTVDYRHYRGRMDMGGLVYRPQQARRIVDGTVPA